MSFTHKKKPLQFKYNIGNHSLVEVSEYKYLGIWITNRLSWNKHIDYVTSNTLRKLFFLKRTLKYSTSDTRLLAYKTIIRPMLEYGNVIWDPFTKLNLTKLERIQNKATRFIFNSYGRTSVQNLVQRAGLQPITERNRVCRLKFLYQIIHGYYKINVQDYITFSQGYSTRQRHSFSIVPFMPRNNCFKYSFFPRTVVEWNELPQETIEQGYLDLFAARLV